MLQMKSIQVRTKKNNRKVSNQPSGEIINSQPKEESNNVSSQNVPTQSSSKRNIEPPSRPLPDLNLVGKQLPPKPKKKESARAKLQPQMNNQNGYNDADQQQQNQTQSNKSPGTRNALY